MNNSITENNKKRYLKYSRFCNKTNGYKPKEKRAELEVFGMINYAI